MNVGMDVVNGEYAILGAREGCYKVLGTDWDSSLLKNETLQYYLHIWEENVLKNLQKL